jgi:hypothetical protein
VRQQPHPVPHGQNGWEIENQGFNDAKNRYGFEHICHHEPQSLLAVWLITCLALTIERLYRLRYLHRGTPSRAGSSWGITRCVPPLIYSSSCNSAWGLRCRPVIDSS